MLEIFHYGFIVRGIEAGLIIALLAPLIGIFLVLKRYSLMADTIAHVSLAGVALGLLLRVNPLITTMITSITASLLIERLRITKKVFGESALALFLSGGLAIAIVLIGLAHGFSVDLFTYLFGSILTVKTGDVLIIAGVGIVVIGLLLAFYKELLYIAFEEEAARVSGIPTNFLNMLFILLAAMTVAISIPIVGILLVSALIVIPVITALQFKKGFQQTIVIAEIISVVSVLAGIFASFYLNLPSGAAIVLVSLIIFLISLMY